MTGIGVKEHISDEVEDRRQKAGFCALTHKSSRGHTKSSDHHVGAGHADLHEEHRNIQSD